MKAFAARPLAWFIAGIHILYFALACFIGRIYLVDSFGYLEQAKNILLHHSWYAEAWNGPTLPDYFSTRPPLYACFILICHFLLHSDFAVLAAQDLLAMLSFFMLWKMLLGFSLSQRTINAVIGCALLLEPSQMIHANIVMSELLLQSLLFGVFYFSIRMFQSGRTKDAVLACFFLSLAMFTKPVVILLGVLMLVFFSRNMVRRKKFTALFAFLLPVAGFHLICLQNKHSTGYYHYSSAKVIYDLRVNARFLLMNKFGADSSHAFVTRTFELADRQLDYEHRYKTIERECRVVIEKYPVVFTQMYARGIVTFFIDPGRFDVFTFFNLEELNQEGFLQRLNTHGASAITYFLRSAPLPALLLLFLALCWNLVLLGGLAGFAFYRKLDPWIRFFVIAFAGYFALVSGISGIARYRVPVYPEIVFAASFIIARFLNRKKEDAPASV